MANVSSNNLTTLYSGGGVNVRPTSAYGNANVVALLNAGTDGANTVTNIVATGNITANNINANIVYHNSTGVAIQSNAWAQLQYTNSNVAPADQTNLGTGSWFFVDSSGAAFESNTTGTTHSILFSNSGNVTAENFIGNVVGNITGSANYANYSNIANTANSVSVANVVGIGNIAVINLDGNVSNILHGDGYWGPESGNLNANFANYAGNVTNSAQPNITSVGTLVNVSVTGNITSVSGVFVGNGAGLSNLTGANVNGTVANANYAAYAGNVTIAGQSNITSLGTLTGLSSNGIVDFANAANVNLGSNSNVHIGGGAANYALITDGAGNLSWGQVANALVANFANFAGNVTNSAQPNITSVGTLSNLSVSGNITSGNANLGNLAVANFFSGNGSLLTGIIALSSNFANYAGNLINGTSNVNTNGANGNISVSVNGVANVATFQNNSINLNYAINTPNYIYIGTNSGNRASIKSNLIAIGTNTATLTNVNDTRTIVIGHEAASSLTLATPGSNTIIIGTSAALQSAGDNRVVIGRGAGQAGIANNVVTIGSVAGTWPGDDSISIGTGAGSLLTSQTNAIAIGSGSQAFSNSIAIGGSAQSNVVNSIVLNATGSVLTQTTANTFTVKPVRNVLTGNAMFYNSSTGEISYDVVGNLVAGNANFANFAGNVTVSSQSNITTLGNLLYANVVDSGNVTGTKQQFSPNTITVGTNSTTNASYNLTTLYGLTSNLAEPGSRAIIRSRGNSATPATAQVNDIGSREQVFFYNGTTNAVGFSTQVTLSNLNSNSNAFTTGTTYNLSVGNPNGDQGNTSALSGFNTLQYDATGTLTLLNGAAPAGTGALQQMLLVNYGHTSGNTNAAVGGIVMRRARGNRDANVTVEPNDQLGRVVFGGYNGTIFQTNRTALVRGIVDSSYVGGNANIPIGLQFITCDNTTSYTHNFYANSNVVFATSTTVTANGGFNTTGVVSATGNITGGNLITGNITASGGTYSLSNGAGGATSLSFIGDKTTNSSFSLFNAQFSVSMSNVNTTTGFSPFRFQQYAPTSSEFGDMFMYRSRGNSLANSAPVVAGDKIMQINFITNSNNATSSVGAFSSSITYNDNAGNVGSKLELNAVGTGTTGYLNGQINLLANTTAANNFTANNVTINNSVNGFMKLSSYTAAALTAITGSVGWMAAVTNSAGGSNPNGMIAFWDTTNSRWSYVHDNSAV